MNNRGGWLQTDKSGIDIAMLSQTNVPILFYDEVMLYQDDLDDCGESTLDIKIRVMPDCWFVLKRLFVRVDDVKVRIRDCRLFHKFGEAAIHMEITWKESTLPLPQHIQSALIKSAVQSSGLPMHAVSSQSLPPSVLLKSGPLAQHLPSIMEYEKLHPFYAFII
jgi:type 2A phosphatase activator TIP41